MLGKCYRCNGRGRVRHWKAKFYQLFFFMECPVCQGSGLHDGCINYLTFYKAAYKYLPCRKFNKIVQSFCCETGLSPKNFHDAARKILSNRVYKKIILKSMQF